MPSGSPPRLLGLLNPQLREGLEARNRWVLAKPAGGGDDRRQSAVNRQLHSRAQGLGAQSKRENGDLFCFVFAGARSRAAD